MSAMWASAGISDDEEHWKLCKCTEKAETAAHQFGEWVTVEAATQTKEGVREHKCDICGKVVQEAIPFLPNTGDSAHPALPGERELALHSAGAQ